MTEQSFTTELLKWAKTYRWRAHHIRNSGFGGNTFIQGDKGFPDLVLLRPPRLIFAELKTAKAGTKVGEPKPEQLAWLNELEGLGHHMVGIETYVWRPEMWSQILMVLSKS